MRIKGVIETERIEAQKMMQKFAETYKGRTVYFSEVKEEERLCYVLISSFNYFRFLPLKQRYDRAISNAEFQEKNGFKSFIQPGERICFID